MMMMMMMMMIMNVPTQSGQPNHAAHQIHREKQWDVCDQDALTLSKPTVMRIPHAKIFISGTAIGSIRAYTKHTVPRRQQRS
jgi:hypothetical protein